MGYFQVRYNCRVVIYDRRGFIRLATGKGGSPGLVVMGGDSRSEGCEFETQHHILDGIVHIDLS